MNSEEINIQVIKIESFREGYLAALKWIKEETDKKELKNADSPSSTAEQ